MLNKPKSANPSCHCQLLVMKPPIYKDPIIVLALFMALFIIGECFVIVLSDK